MRRPGLLSAFLAMWLCLALAACGGGGGSSTSTGGGTTPTSNVLAVVVSAGPTGNFANMVLTSVTICVPGTSTCQTIPNVMVDTGSTGLRLLASAVSIPLPGTASASGTYSECVAFADGVVWGPVVKADVQLSGETAASLGVHLIRDNAVGAGIPRACTNQGAEEDSLSALGANGILGVGLFLQDCGSYCASTVDAIYFDCTAAGVCNPATMPVASQVANPVASFAQDNNGVVLQLASISPNGASAGTGNLIFGIGTQTNNGLSAAIIPVSGTNGYFTASYGGTSYPNSFMDSGSSGLFFDTNGITQCTSSGATGYYCPGTSSSLSAVSVTASLQGTSGSAVTTTVSVANALFLFSVSSNNAFNDLAGPAGSSLSGSFDFGVPFFFGKSVYTAIEGRSTPNGTGPYFAFQ